MAKDTYYGTGRRKSSVARVYLSAGTGRITINKRGCDEFVHHLDTVVGEQPNSLDSQRLDFFFSANITFKRLRSLLAAISYYYIIATKLNILFDITTKNLNNLRNLMN